MKRAQYILPETNSESFETDIVVLNPSYPQPLRNREEILVGGVAAAFSVKLTLNAAGIQDGVEWAAALRLGCAKSMAQHAMRWSVLFLLGS
jgi:hypothetical protein